jgi:hypothetical protein
VLADDYWEKSIYDNFDDPEYRPVAKARLTWKIKGVRGTKDKPNRAKIMRSPPAFVGGYWWTIKNFPRGNAADSLSIYIECSKDMPRPDEKMPETEFKVLCGNPSDNLSDIPPQIQVQFSKLENTDQWFEEYKQRYRVAGINCDLSGSTNEKKPVWRAPAQIGVILYNPQEPRTGYIQSSCHQFNPYNPNWGWPNFHGPWNQIHIRQTGQRQALLRNDTLAFDTYIRVFDDPTQSLWWHL